MQSLFWSVAFTNLFSVSNVSPSPIFPTTFTINEHRSHAHTMPHMFNRNTASGQWVHTAVKPNITQKNAVCLFSSKQIEEREKKKASEL